MRAGPEHLRRRVRRGPWYLAPIVAAALVVAMLSAAGPTPGSRGPGDRGRGVDVQMVSSPRTASTTSTSTSTTTSTSTSTTTTTTVPAGSSPSSVPADFTDQLDGYYDALYDIVTSVPGASSGASQISDPSDFSSQVADLTPDELSDLYSVTSQYDNYSAQTPTLQQISDEASDTATALGVHVTGRSAEVTRKAALTTPRAVVSHDAGGEVVAQSLTVIPPTEPTSGSWAGDVSGLSLTYQATCPSGAPTNNDPYGEYDIFAIDEALDAAYAVYNVLSAGMPEYDIPIVGPISQTAFAVASAIAAAVALALQIAYDTLNWEQTVSGDCQNLDIQQMTLDEDNNAFQTYQLLTGVAATTNEVDTNVSNLTNQEATELANLTTLQIEEALSAPTDSAPQARMELPGPAGLLNTTPGVEEVVSNAVTQMSNEGQLSSSSAERDLGLAEQAQSAGEYKLAYSYYQLAYQAASN